MSELVEALPADTLFIDLADAVRRHYSDPASALLHFERDSHPNELAHELIADEIIHALDAGDVF